MGHSFLAELQVIYREKEMIFIEKGISEETAQQTIIIPISQAVQIAFETLYTYKAETIKEMIKRTETRKK